MTHKTLTAIILILAVTVGVLVGIIILILQPPEIVLLLPNEGQLQQILNAIEPNSPLKVDYHIGGKSREKWNRIVNDAYAKHHFGKE